MTSIESPFEKVEALQALLVSYATGKGGEEGEYKILRAACIADPVIAERLPRLVHRCRNLSQFWNYIQGKFPRYHERRAHLWGEFRPVLEFLESGLTNPVTAEAESALLVIDAPHVQSAWKNASARRESDPEGAITVARTLLESVCKHILDKASITYTDDWDLPKLYKAAAECLNLAPQQHTELVFRQILGGCHTVVEGLGSLRNKHGDAHGKGKGHIRPSARHAALAVNIAGTVATFLVSTLEEKGIKS